MTRAEQLAYDVRNAYYLELGRMAGCEHEVSGLLEIDDRGFRDFVFLRIENRLEVRLS